MVDVEDVTRFARTLPNVVVADNYKFLCSDPGQLLIQDAIREHQLDRVVVAACSPLMHEHTFRRAIEKAGLNPYMLEVANIREQCSWVTDNKGSATSKACALVSAAVYGVAFNEPLERKEVPINPNTLVVGGGIAGIQAALDLADAGHHVYLVEREPSIGGHMAKFDKTFPTLDCAACILTPKMVAVGQHENITLLTNSEVESLSGYIGNFKVKVKVKPRFVDMEKCNGCGECWNNCPALTVPALRKMTIGGRVFKSGRIGGNNGSRA
jgi:heterodisulfide reductase subunit A